MKVNIQLLSQKLCKATTGKHEETKKEKQGIKIKSSAFGVRERSWVLVSPLNSGGIIT